MAVDIILNIKEYTDTKCEEAVLNGDVDLGFAIAHFDKEKFDYQIVKYEKIYAIINKHHNKKHQQMLNTKISIEYD